MSDTLKQQKGMRDLKIMSAASRALGTMQAMTGPSPVRDEDVAEYFMAMQKLFKNESAVLEAAINDFLDTIPTNSGEGE